MSNLTLETDIITNKNQLTEIFFSGCKQEKKIGLEYEKLPIYNQNFKAVTFSGEKSISAIFEKLSQSEEWTKYKEQDITIGLENHNGAISLEPGCQFELSLNPYDSIHEIANEVNRYNSITTNIANEFDISWLGYGIQPVSTFKDIKVIPKKRYESMTNYLTKVAQKPLVMMRETAGIQVNFDYENEENAINKMAVALKLSPIVSAIYANSPIRDSVETGFKSYRASSWLDTDPSRCGLVSKGLFEKNTAFSFEEYTEILLDVPMIFIEKEGKHLFVNDLTFRQYLHKGFHGHFPTIKDWETHISLYFPDVRFKNYLEIRNHDSQRQCLIPSIPALWKGLLYNADAVNAVNNLLKHFNYLDFECIRHNTPKHGLDLKIKDIEISTIAKEIVNIAYNSLQKQGWNEAQFLEPLLELTNQKLTPADVILQNWNGSWNKDISKLIEYSKIG